MQPNCFVMARRKNVLREIIRCKQKDKTNCELRWGANTSLLGNGSLFTSPTPNGVSRAFAFVIFAKVTRGRCDLLGFLLLVIKRVIKPIVGVAGPVRLWG